MNKETIKAAREALDSLDDYARMNTGVDAIGPRSVLERFISEVERTTAPVTTHDTSQDWAKLDGAQAFHLIERHADGWAETGNMMESWLAARMAAAPAPIQQEPQAAQLAVITHAKAHSTTVVIKLMQDGKATCIYSADHSANGESIGVSDLPDSIFHIAKQAVEPCGGCGETDPANRCIGCRHPFSATPPALAGSQVQAAGDTRVKEWERACREIIDRCVAPDMYRNAREMLDRAVTEALRTFP